MFVEQTLMFFKVMSTNYLSDPQRGSQGSQKPLLLPRKYAKKCLHQRNSAKSQKKVRVQICLTNFGEK